MDPADISSFFTRGNVPPGDSSAIEPVEDASGLEGPRQREVKNQSPVTDRERNGFLRGGAGPGFINGAKDNQVSLVDKVIDAVTKKLAGSDLKQVINERVIDPAFDLLLQRSIPYLVVAGIAYFILLLLLVGIFIILIKHSKALGKLSAPLPASTEIPSLGSS